MELNIRYAVTADGVRIAFAIAGQGVPVIRAPYSVFIHCQLEWRQSDFFERFTRHRMVVDDAFINGRAYLDSPQTSATGAGEILVPETVRGLLSGKGFVFGDRGEFVPKGFDEGVRLWEVRWRE